MAHEATNLLLLRTWCSCVADCIVLLLFWPQLTPLVPQMCDLVREVLELMERTLMMCIPLCNYQSSSHSAQTIWPVTVTGNAADRDKQ
jgi:hypothetical protein